MRPIMVSRRMLGWLGLLAAVVVAGCTAGSTSGSVAPGQGGSVSRSALTAVSPGAAPGSAPTRPGGVRALAISRDVRNELTAAFADYKGISPSDVAGIRPGSVYGAYDPATYTYWALANFLPSSTAPVKVLLSFQDGASIGLFTRIANGSWQVQSGGEPAICAEVRFFPPAVLTAWSLPTGTAGFGCSSAPARPAPVRPVTSQLYAVTISLPVSWQPTLDLGPPEGSGYDGTSGWVQLNATADPFGLHTRCTDATLNVLHPYGLHPLIIYRSIDGRPGCLIFPSSDAPALARRAGGPALQDSEALVEYRQPGAGGSGCISPTGQPCLWSLLVIDADPSHLAAIVDSIQLHH